MDIVVDANVIFAALVREGSTEKLLFSDHLHLYAPEYLLLEIKEHDWRFLKEDAVYLALCIAMKMPLWSNDKGFKEQNKVKIYTTKELLEEFG